MLNDSFRRKWQGESRILIDALPIAGAMKPCTIRLDHDEVDELDREAEQRGFGNRTEYLRWIIRNRPAVEPTTAETLDGRLDELEERLEQVESKFEE